MKFKKLLMPIIILFVLIIMAIAYFDATGIFTGNHVKEYDVIITVDEFGHIEVNETIVINYKSYHNYLIRDIKYGKYNYNNEPYNKYESSFYTNDKASLDNNSFDVKVYRGDIVNEPDFTFDITKDVSIGYSFNGDYYNSESGEHLVECLPGSGECEAVSVDAYNKGTLVDLMSFEYNYKINGMITSFNDISELNYKVFEYMGMKVKNATVTVILPFNNNDVSNFYMYGHGLVEGNLYKQSSNVFKYRAKNIKEDEEFEIRLLFPNNVVSLISDTNKVNLNLKDDIKSFENRLASIAKTQRSVILIFNILTGLVCLGMVFIFRHVYLKYDKEFKPKFDLDYLRELPFNYPPAIMSYLYHFAKVNDEDVTATLLDLIRRGYLELIVTGNVNDKKPDFTIKLVEDKNTKDLMPHETHLINWFINVIGLKGEVTIQQIESFGNSYAQAQKHQENATAFSRKVKDTGEKFDFFINTTRQKSKAFSFTSILIIFAALLIFVGFIYNISFTVNLVIIAVIGLIYLIYVTNIKKRSLNGAEEFAKWNAFKRFLEDFSSFEDYPIPGIIVWEEYLSYATSLKIADKVMQQLKVKLPSVTENGTYLSNHHSSIGFNHFIFARVNYSVRQASRNTTQSISAHNAKSFRGGGGFSGGSSSGGGGGGFRGGR